MLRDSSPGSDLLQHLSWSLIPLFQDNKDNRKSKEGSDDIKNAFKEEIKKKKKETKIFFMIWKIKSNYSFLVYFEHADLNDMGAELNFRVMLLSIQDPVYGDTTRLPLDLKFGAKT